MWTAKHDRAFETLKGALLTHPVMSLPVPNRTYRLATDASKIALGAVLSQLDEHAEEHPVAYFSKKLSPTEAKSDIWELEWRQWCGPRLYVGTTSAAEDSNWSRTAK